MYTTLIIAKTRCFVNTANGAKASAILYSLAATAQANNVVFSEVTDSNFNYGNVAPDDSYNVSGTRSAKGSDDKKTQYYTIVEGVGDYQCSQDALIIPDPLKYAAKVTYGDTSSVLKEGKQRVTYTINRELLDSAPDGTRITDAGLLYYNGINAGNAAQVNAHKLIDKVGTYIYEEDRTNIVKKAHVAASRLSNNKASLTVNILDNGYGTVILGFVEVTDTEGNSAIIYAEKTVVDEATLKEETIKPAALSKSYASANVEAEKAAQAAISVEILPLTYSAFVF